MDTNDSKDTGEGCAWCGAPISKEPLPNGIIRKFCANEQKCKNAYHGDRTRKALAALRAAEGAR